MKKAKYNEVPKDYRRNYKKEIINFLAMFAVGFIIVAIMVALVAIAN